MDIVSAGVHHARVAGGKVGSDSLLNGEGVNISPNGDGLILGRRLGSGLAVDNAHHAVSGDSGGVGDPPPGEPGADDLLGALLVFGKLGMLVDVAADGNNFAVYIGNTGADLFFRYHGVLLIE